MDKGPQSNLQNENGGNLNINFFFKNRNKKYIPQIANRPSNIHVVHCSKPVKENAYGRSEI